MPQTIEECPNMIITPQIGLGYVFALDKSFEGWELGENVSFDTQSTLSLAALLEGGESEVTGTVMLERTKELGTHAGQRHAEQMIRQQVEIPEEYQPFCLLFPGTKWRKTRGGSVWIPYLGGEIDKGWHLLFLNLDKTVFTDSDRIVLACE